MRDKNGDNTSRSVRVRRLARGRSGRGQVGATVAGLDLVVRPHVEVVALNMRDRIERTITAQLADIEREISEGDAPGERPSETSPAPLRQAWDAQQRRWPGRRAALVRARDGILRMHTREGLAFSSWETPGLLFRAMMFIVDGDEDAAIGGREIVVDGERVRVPRIVEKKRTQIVRAGAAAFEAFLELGVHGAALDDVAAFARRHGRLGVCACGDPLGSPSHLATTRCDLSDVEGVWEPLHAWQSAARKAWAMIEAHREIGAVRASGRSDLPLGPALRSVLRSGGTTRANNAAHPTVLSVDDAERQLHRHLETWLADAPTRFAVVLDYTTQRAIPGLRTASVLGLVGLHLQARLLGRPAIPAVCKGPTCSRPGRLFFPSRADDETCSDACKKAWQRLPPPAQTVRNPAVALALENQALREQIAALTRRTPASIFARVDGDSDGVARNTR